MPPRRPVSPLNLETCSPPTSDLCNDGLLGSDDELNDEERAAQRRRIEKLAESYLQGKPLFILSASLRGRFDEGWVNPWKTNRRRAIPPGRSTIRPPKEPEIPASPVINETNSRRRRTYQEPQEIRDSRPPTVAPESDIHVSGRSRHASVRLDRSGDKRNRRSISPNTPRRSIPWARPVDSTAQLQSLSTSRHTNETWLKKDRKQISFQNVDPPTSPTTTLSSRYSIKSRASRDARMNSQSTSFEHKDGPYSERSTSSSPAQDGPDPEPLDVSRVPNSIASSPAKEQRLPDLGRERTTSGAVSQGPSFCVLAPSSHLPQFEYRRKKPRVSNEAGGSKPPTAGEPDAEEEPRAADFTKGTQLPEQDALSPQHMHSAHANRHGLSEADKDPRGIFISTSTTKAIGNISVSQSAKFRSISTVNKGNTSERLPSAQQVRANPTMTDITSLHSIAVPRSNSEYDDDTIPDPQFSTQAALLHAQRSFQNDLDSPEHDIPSPDRQHASKSSDLSSPIAKDITPFHRLSTPNRARGSSGVQAPMTAGQWQSTQCMIDAVTPFTFSTEKKPNRRTMSPVKHLTGRKKLKTASFKLSSPPSSASSEARYEQDNNYIHSSPVPRRSPGHETQHSVLPMTLTGTTPPTAQEGQRGFPGADSFNLAEAIADAGSWLQQSFDLNRDLRLCETSKSAATSSAGTRRSAIGVDGKK
ncbi:hypothetical protein F9C07_1372792 [Aspergillus flavus]|uniref:Uncharacterized protein n=1 Tax=Aspergillus flavus (strain ATCC 200026 / FGSC A1120 / IAM 13836 / NRRL 3357 / JCM 12722 / SRRC 167) TaxID=332952 RepID=A0A7G5JZW1_ASPFN|nr:uncharacterized protein G4B84_004413 [Aspergillus flavus NRRL3357]KAF7617685.1 hypothetical protein AFLA_006599 [Aspergillus flavus NRRL3357]QMW29078.1 hypothetical protein G4B84_004413 [Aspergillus flavus NRRL3357]QMW41153.1 hypothetical protein G4B11_004477 [Aspergillus flavus]QRD85360.1 hypothetical protein F9C07_1372792 [Aspergillus flavus]